MDSLLETGSLIGIGLLFLNMAVSSQISSQTKAEFGDTETMHNELEQWLGDHAKNPILNFIVAVLGLGASVWLPVYVGLFEGVLSGVLSCVVLVVASALLGKLIFRSRIFPILYSICGFTGTIGLYLTIVSLIN